MAAKGDGRIGVGFVGLSARGHWAAHAHVPALRKLPEFEIRGLVASSAASARAAAEKFDVPFHTDSVTELANRPDIDLVVVAVKLPAHREAVAAALDAGKMVLCEWPLGNGLQETRDLAEMARSKGIRSFIGLQARAAPPIVLVRDLVRQGYVGDVLSTSVVATLGPPWNGTVGLGSTYLLDAQNGATMLSIPFGHTLDALCLVLGELRSVSGEMVLRRGSAKVIETGDMVAMTAHDQVAVVGQFASGAVLSMHYRAASGRATGFRWEINGTDGDLIVEGGNGHLQYGRVRVLGGRGEAAALTELELPPEYLAFDIPAGDLSRSVAHAYRNVLQDITDGTRRAPDFDDAVTAHRRIDLIEQSALGGRRLFF